MLSVPGGWIGCQYLREWGRMLSVPGGLDRRFVSTCGSGAECCQSVPGGVGQNVISTWGSGAENCQYLGGMGEGGLGRREYVSQTIIQFIIL